MASKHGKKYQEALRKVEDALQSNGADGLAPLPACQVVKDTSTVRFDATVELHARLGVDARHADQQVRGAVSLPNGTGKTIRVLCFVGGDKAREAQEAGADYVGGDDLIERIKGGWTDFDVALATQDMMGPVARLGKILGPRGLMPTPKAGTVITGDIATAVREFKAGKVEYRTDKGGNVHAGVGKLSFDEDKLSDNIVAFVDQVRAVKPAGVKGNYVKSITVTSTMGPGIPVTV